MIFRTVLGISLFFSFGAQSFAVIRFLLHQWNIRQQKKVLRRIQRPLLKNPNRNKQKRRQQTIFFSPPVNSNDTDEENLEEEWNFPEVEDELMENRLHIHFPFQRFSKKFGALQEEKIMNNIPNGKSEPPFSVFSPHNIPTEFLLLQEAKDQAHESLVIIVFPKKKAKKANVDYGACFGNGDNFSTTT